MLVKFQSKAAAEVLMYKEHAKRILDLLHKDVNRGVITAAEMANAVVRLEAEIQESKLHSGAEEVHRSESSDDNEREPLEQVSFAVRAYPLLEMLRAALKENRDVMWGV